MLLATDLDGTFLAGHPEQRLRLYQLITVHPEIKLVFVTRRGLEVVMPLLSDPSVPTPDFIICDVGASVVDGRTLQPVQPRQADIDARWPGERDLAVRLHQAIAMNAAEAQSRLRELFAIVEHNDIHAWGKDFLDAASAADACTGVAPLPG